MGLTLGDDVLRTVATQITAGARELRGALHRLASDEPGVRRADHARAGRASACRFGAAQHARRAAGDVQKAVCDVFGVEPAQLRSERKGRAVSEPRMLAMWLARKYTRAAWSEIGQFFGRRSHSTVICGPPPRGAADQHAGGDRPQRSAVQRGRRDPPVGDGAAHGVDTYAIASRDA